MSICVIKRSFDVGIMKRESRIRNERLAECSRITLRGRVLLWAE